MKIFNFYAPTQVVFGRNTETQVAELVKIYEMNAILNEKSETDSCQYFCFGLSFSNSPLSSYSFRTCSILRIQRSSISTFSA